MDDVKKEFKADDRFHVFSVYLVEASMNIPINIPQGDRAEHSTYLWADSDSAMSKLTWDDDKAILNAVLEGLK